MKTFKYRIYPTKAQETIMLKVLSLCCWIWNQTLEMRDIAWKEEECHVGYLETKRMLPIWKAEKPELKAVHSQVLQDVTMRIDLAFQAFFRRAKEGAGKPGYPRFRSWQYYGSFTYPQAGTTFKVLDNGKLHLSKIGDVKIILHRPLEGVSKTLTIKRDRLGKWYACFACKTKPESLPENPNVIGVDVGLTHFATLSSGERIANPRFLKREEKALNKARSQRSKSPRGSPRRKQLTRRVNHIEQRITNRRTDFAHKISRQLVGTYQVIVFEDLDIQEMMNGNWRSMNRSIADAAWGQLVAFTEQKAKTAGRVVIKVSPRGTTQRCSSCGKVVPKDLSVRIHDCPYCGLVLDRDHNAALNILALGLQCIGSNPWKPKKFGLGSSHDLALA